MIKLGLRAHDLGKRTPVDMAHVVKSLGLSAVQLVINKAISLDEALNDKQAKKIAEAFKTQNVEIAMLGAYFNPIHSNDQKRNNSLNYFKLMLSYSEIFNCSYVGTETGSYHDDKWIYHPNNHKEAAFQAVLTAFKELDAYRQDNQINAKIAIEGAFNHVIYNPQTMKRLLDELNSDGICITLDLFNYLNIDNHEDHVNIFKQAIELFGDRIAIIHLKDYTIQNNSLVQVPVGQGIMNYQAIMNLINRLSQELYLIFEGTKQEHLQSSIDYIKSK